MKKADPIQLIILVIALLLVYNAILTFPYFLWLLYSWLSEGLTLADSFYRVCINCMYLAFYIIGAIVLVKKSKAISHKVANAASFSADVNILLKRDDIIYAVFVTMGAYILTTRLPKLLLTLYSYIRERNKPFSTDNSSYAIPGESWPESIAIVIFAAVMLVYAKTLTEYITRHIKEDTDVDTIGTAVDEN